MNNNRLIDSAQGYIRQYSTATKYDSPQRKFVQCVYPHAIIILDFSDHNSRAAILSWYSKQNTSF